MLSSFHSGEKMSEKETPFTARNSTTGNTFKLSGICPILMRFLSKVLCEKRGD